jgi:hypothetical protein
LLALVGFPQTISLIAYIIHQSLFLYDVYYHSYLIAIVVYVALGMLFIINIVHFIYIYRLVKADKIYRQWCIYGTSLSKINSSANNILN